jgi:hypothetical protein
MQKKVSLKNFVPDTFPKLICKFTQEINRYDKLHIDCTRENYQNPIMWEAFRTKHFYSHFHLIESFLTDKEEWGCGHCNRGLFVCLFIHPVSVTIVILVK